jgi:hypothetical protein
MPTKRVPIDRAPVQLTPTEWRWLMDEPEPPEEEGGDPAELFFINLHGLWVDHRAMVLPLWVREHPGTRPSHWWRWDAPRAAPGTFGQIQKDLDGTPLPEPRRRLGGVGTPAHEGRGDFPTLGRGIPVAWLMAPLGRAPAYDPTDPPIFESEAAYLERHGLFMRGERHRLTAEDFAPERIELADRVH